ncbi:unnamed protein product [Rotaria sp. Silwood1]|nr:unnamed protein product [Rotaria sp. Silwood1]
MTSEQQMEYCSECNAIATWYCVQDNANFCDQHNNFAHLLKSQKLHKFVSIDEKAVTIENQTAKPLNCKAHHMPLSLYCLFCKDVCCVACISVNNHKQHSDQVKSVVDVAKGEKNILNKYLEKIRKLQTTFADELSQLQQALKNIDIIESKTNQDIDKQFDRIMTCVENRRKVLKQRLKETSQTCRHNMHSKQEDLNNINSSLKKCLEDGRHTLTLNDYAALTRSKAIIDKIKNLENENVEHYHCDHLVDSISFHISIQTLLEMIDTSGIVGEILAPSFVKEKCKLGRTYLEIEWESIQCEPPITAYILEVRTNNTTFREYSRCVYLGN